MDWFSFFVGVGTVGWLIVILAVVAAMTAGRKK